MRNISKIAIFIFINLVYLVVHGQNLISSKLELLKSKDDKFRTVELFSFNQGIMNSDNSLGEILKEFTLLNFNKISASELIQNGSDGIVLIIPFSQDSIIELELFRSSIVTPDFSVLTGSGEKFSYDLAATAQYWGIIKGDNNSVCAISVYQNELMGMLSSPTSGNIILGQLKGGPDEPYILYKENDLLISSNIECTTEADDVAYSASELILPAAVSSNCIRLYWELNHDIFLDKGSVNNSVNYAVALFNQSAILYANDNIPVELSQVFIWDVPSPYSGPGTANYLQQFQSYRNTFAGDLGHLLGYSGSGGVAASVNGLCATNIDYSQCYSGVSGSFQNVPVYSWSVEVVTHEQGHLLGSRHTHGCVWNGNNTAIDGCGPSAGYPYEGSCSGASVPSGGGTIMSYCHLAGVGINFSLGFGSQPAAVILNKFNSSSCLSACTGGGFCSAATGMTTNNISNSSATFDWISVSGAVQYRVQYRLRGTSVWTVDSTSTNSYTVSGLIPGSDYEWQVQTVCASNSAIYTSLIYFITVPLVCNAPVGMSTTNVSSQSAVFSWSPATAAIGYNIQYRAVGTTLWTTRSSVLNSYNASGLIPNTYYEWQVQTICAGGGTSGHGNLVTFNTLETGASTTIVLQPGSECGKDALLGSNIPSGENIRNFGNSEELNALAWTAGGGPSLHRSLIDFDLSFIPTGSLVTSAYLSMYWNPSAGNPGHSTLSGPNTALLRKVTSPWSESQVTWVNQPGTDSIGQINLAPSTGATDDYLNIDVTTMIQDFVNNPNSNYGMMLQQESEIAYRSLVFASSDHPVDSIRPRLEITYSPNVEECLILKYAGCEGIDAVIGNCVLAGYDTSNFGSSPEFDALAWTFSGTITDLRSLIYWNFSSIPTNAIVTDAKLTLYWNPNSSNTGHSITSGSNEATIVKITDPWDENDVTWNTQPATDTLNQAYVPISTSQQQDFVIDVSALVQDMVANPADNYGMMLKLLNETYFRSLIFCSSDHPDPDKHPKIEVCYTIPTNVSKINSDSEFGMYVDYLAERTIVSSNKDFDKSTQLNVYTVDGKLLNQYDGLTGKKYSFSISGWSPGIYFVQMVSKLGTNSGKIVLQKAR
ncbi:MAG TPA: DNRLRE domain-containing protein [Bacteroidia bacterium]|nr:DNRLRE domain-containing protein [Bacteroidia bacterium]